MLRLAIRTSIRLEIHRVSHFRGVSRSARNEANTGRRENKYRPSHLFTEFNLTSIQQFYLSIKQIESHVTSSRVTHARKSNVSNGSSDRSRLSLWRTCTRLMPFIIKIQKCCKIGRLANETQLKRFKYFGNIFCFFKWKTKKKKKNLKLRNWFSIS